MKKIAMLSSALIVSASLCGCVVEPSPYYGGSAPYYGTAYAPAYAYGTIGIGGYYPYQRSQHIYSNYNANYWHNQRGAAVARPASHSVSHEDRNHR